MSSDRVTYTNFVARLIATVPELKPLTDVHFDDHDELLLHVLIADITRHTQRAFRDYELELLGRVLAFLNDAFLNGDEQVENAVALSFIAHSEWWTAESSDFIATWPEGLQKEAEAQRRWNPIDPSIEP